MKAWYAILLLVGLVGSFFAGYSLRGNSTNAMATTDTVVVVDTLRDTVPVLVQETNIETIDIPYFELVTVCGDTIKDTIYVPIPITQKEYKTDRYHAWVSGYRPALDSINIFTQTAYITKHMPARRWGLGVMAGYGISRSGLSPYAGIGVYYRIW